MTLAVIAAPLAGLVLLLVIVAMMVWQGLMQRRLTQLAESIEGKPYWRICLASNRFPQLRHFRLAWRAHGLLIDDGNTIRLLKVASPMASTESWVFEKQRASMQWLAGSEFGSMNWIRLTPGGQDALLFSLAASPSMGYPNNDELRDLARTLFPEATLPPLTRHVFELRDGRRTTMAYTATALLAIGALVDTFTINHSSLAITPLLEHAINGKKWILIPLAFVCLAILQYLFFRRDEIRTATKVGNAMTIALTLMVSATPWAKRVDQWLPHDPAFTHAYKIDASGNLNPWPAIDAMPLLLPNDLRLAKDALSVGSEFPVNLTHGALGLWQVMTPSPALLQRDRGENGDRRSNFPWDLLFLPLMLVALLIPWQLQKKHVETKRIQDGLADRVNGAHFRRVELARTGFLQRKFKLIPYEALGVLVDETTHLRLLGQWPDQAAPFDIRVHKAHVKLLKHSSLWANSPARVRVEVATPQGAISFVPEQSLTNRHASGMAKQRSNDLMRSVFPDRVDEMAQHWPFAIESSPAAMAVIVVSLAMAVWAALDTYVWNPFALASELTVLLPNHPLLFATALLTASGTTAWALGVLPRHKVPTTESVALAILLASGILSASLPAAKRLDRHMATEESGKYSYVRTESDAFKPQQPNVHLPTLTGLVITRDAPAPESAFQVTLVKGWLGFWQYDRYQLMRDVYESAHPNEKGHSQE